MSTPSQVGAPAQSMKTLTAATIVGNTIEFYDFNVYGSLTALVFGRLFFSDADPVVATLLALGTFAVGFISRPLGGIIFGHFGDRYGRKPVLVVSLLTMGSATFLMGLLPTFEAVGLLAPALLVILRFIQGFGIGGEWGGAITMMMESAPSKRRGLFGSAVQTGSGLGIILAAGVVAILVAVLSPAELLAWGWRIPLLLSVVLVGVGLVVRLRIEESPVFEKLEIKSKVARAPLFETLRRHYRIVLLSIGMYIAVAAFGFTQGVFFISYLLDSVHVSETVATFANLIASVVYLFATLLGGWMSDRFGRVRTYLLGGILLIPAPFIMFGAGATGSATIIFVIMALIGVITGIGYGSQAALFFELFPSRVRYTGVSLGFQTAAVLGGGLTPLLAESLVQSSGTTIPVSVYMAALAVLMVVCTLFAPRVVRLEMTRAKEVAPLAENAR